MNGNGEPTHVPGSEVDTADVFVPDSYQVYAAMASDPAGVSPATPTIYVELDGFMVDDLPLAPGGDRTPTKRMRILLEVPGAEGIAAGILNSLGQLRRLAKNQERP
ncbi:hypothetical protein LJR045_000956 [Microbacterium sp. LjRoot45]|uniref:hypothetical protein n=1 Tax=Microbacterium sp. LjRoot45 TaxID=3342329 RepID=UPI003ECC45EB